MQTDISTSAVCLFVGMLSTATFAAAEVTAPPASERFARADTEEVPGFQQHVVPLLGRLGCNGRACHGSFQGRGGFRLSLFGYDFKMDHAALTGRATSKDGLRVNQESPGESLIVRKPSMDVDHEGGQRFVAGSWEHHLLMRWVASGNLGVERPRELKTLKIEPSEIVFGDKAVSVQLRVVAVWQDGTREDVTGLCRFRTNDDAIVTVDREGRLHSTGHGDTHVIAFYDNGVKAVPVMRGMSGQAETKSAPLSATTEVDGFISAKLRKLGIAPSAICSDAEFLRRASIDLTGTLPTPDEVEQFLADPSSDKRHQKIDALLGRPAYAAWWANKLCDFTGCNPNRQAELGQETSLQWYTWIYDRLGRNVPYDELIEGIVLAKGRHEGQSYDDYAAERSAYFRDESPIDFTRRETMPHYWSRQTQQKPEEKALAFAHSFLGIRLQCAQCHKHPFAPWTQEDFKQFAAFFNNIQYGVAPGAKERYRELANQVGLSIRGKNGSPVRRDVLKHARAGRTVPWRELYVSERSGPASLDLLRTGIVELGPKSDSRIAIMGWMNEADNPWFARAFVNRVWASYFHIGIVDPPDDLNPANPPSNPELLDWLAASFVDRNYDMKWLHRQIVASQAYQRSWKPNDTNREDRRNFSRAIPRRIPAEVVYDGLKQAVAGSDQLDEVRNDLTRRAIGHLSMRLAGTYSMQVFGKPDRAVNCDCERVNQPTLLQSVFLQNDPLVEQRINESGWIQEIADSERAGNKVDRSKLIRAAWLRTVNRPPSAEETEKAEKHLAGVDSLSEGMRDLVWALINTKEFILNQ
ncbi:MAG: DUF1549 domain-containing protein [Planctomycetes bacterium]|nr:DUF1549 domain-containing protein [Planctomycetota bacterium]